MLPADPFQSCSTDWKIQFNRWY